MMVDNGSHQYQLYTAQERPNLLDHLANPKHPLYNIWPKFLDQVPTVIKYEKELTRIPELARFQYLIAINELENTDNEHSEGRELKVIGVAKSIPFYWPGLRGANPAASLPENGWDAVITNGVKLAKDLRRDRKSSSNLLRPNALSGLSVMVDPVFRGKGVAEILIQAMKDAATDANLEALVIPVRPTWKSQHPTTSISEYIKWTGENEKNLYDPWLRKHLRLGGKVLKIANRSMLLEATGVEWTEWTGIDFEDESAKIIGSGGERIDIDGRFYVSIIISGGLVPPINTTFGSTNNIKGSNTLKMAEDPPTMKVELSRTCEVLMITVLSLTQAMQEACLGQVIAPLHIIGESLGTANPEKVSWFAASYSLTVGTFILIAGRWGDVYGHKNILIFGWVWLSVWSFVTGFSIDSGQTLFNICRAFQGIGPALLIPNAIAILGRIYPPGRKKNIVFGIFGSMAPAGFVFGALFASLFAQLSSWRWSFWATAGVSGILGFLTHLYIPILPATRMKNIKKEKLDLVGSVMGVAGLVLVNFAWNQAPIVGWYQPYTYISLACGLLLLILFFLYELKTPYPLVYMRSLTGEVVITLGIVSAGFASFGIWELYTFNFIEVIRGSSPLSASAQFLPIVVFGFAAAVVTGFLLERLGSNLVLLYAMIAFTVGILFVGTAPVDETYWCRTFLSIALVPWGVDAAFPSSTVVLSDSMPDEHQGAAASIVNTIINYSISIGLGLAATVESEINDGNRNILRGYRGAFYLGIGLGALGVILTLAVVISERYRLSKKMVAKIQIVEIRT